MAISSRPGGNAKTDWAWAMSMTARADGASGKLFLKSTSAPTVRVTRRLPATAVKVFPTDSPSVPASCGDNAIQPGVASGSPARSAPGSSGPRVGCVRSVATMLSRSCPTIASTRTMGRAVTVSRSPSATRMVLSCSGPRLGTMVSSSSPVTARTLAANAAMALSLISWMVTTLATPSATPSTVRP